MRHPFVPLAVLVWLPLGLALAAARRPRGPVRWLLIAAAGVPALVAGSVAGGVEYASLNRMKMLVAAATVVLLLMRRWGVGGLSGKRPFVVALVLLAVPAWVVHLNFFSFHGTGATRVFLHLHDVAHYYLGSKYFDELGYTGLYTAMLRAEAELYDDHFKSIEARDLQTNGLYHIRVLLERSGPVKARFTPERWHDFRRDVAYFREALGPQYGDVLRDHGFNATPVWTLFGSALSRLVPAGSRRGILLLTLLDPVLEVALFAAVAWAFGLEAMLLAMIYFCVLFGASFGWIGGGFLRYAWLLGLIGSVCFRCRGHPAAAGALLAFAASLRIFPAFFAFGAACRAADRLIRRHRVAPSDGRFLAAFAVVGLALGGATLARPDGWEHWREFTRNMERHVQVAATNLVGLPEIVTYDGATFPTNEAEATRAAERWQRLYGLHLLTLVPLVLLFVALRSRREDEVGAMALGALLVFASLSLASYYYLFLLVLLLAHARRPALLALLFAAEVAGYAVGLFEDRDVVLYFYRSVLVAYVLIALHAEALRDEGSRLAARARAAIGRPAAGGGR